jgi:hypothetical protein
LADQVTDNRTGIATGEIADPGGSGLWENLGGTVAVLDGEISYDTYTGSIGDFCTTTRDGTFWNAEATGLFSSGDHAYLLINCGIVSLLDTKANGGMTVRVTGATATDWAEFELFGSDDWPDAFAGGWSQIVVDIDELLANPTNTNGTPPTVGNIQRFGVTFITATVMPRMADNFWVGGFAILGANTPAIIIEGRDGGSSDWNFSSVAAVAAVQLSAVLLPGTGGAFNCRGPLQVGISDSSTHAFSDTNKTLLWDFQEVMLDGFYGLSAIGNSGGTTDFDLGLKTGSGNGATGAQGGVIQADVTGARWFLDFDDPDIDSANFYGVNMLHGEIFELDDPAVDIATVTMIDCSKAHFSNANVVRLSVVDPDTADGVAFCDTDDLGDIANSNFAFSDGHGIEILASGPSSQNNIGNIFTGGYGGTPGDNNTPSSGSNDAMIFNNSAAAKIFNRSGGGTQPSFRNGASATSDDVAAISLTFTPLEVNSEVRLFETGTNVEIDGVENSGTSFVASAGASQALDYKIINPGFLEIFVINVSFATSQNVNINQQIDRNFDPVD